MIIKMKQNIYITHAKRTAIGNFCGALANLSAVDLGSNLISSTFNEAERLAADKVVMGQVLTAGCGQNPARATAIRAGIPQEKPSYTVNQVCGSGMKALHLGVCEVALGADFVIAGGQESMSNAPHILCARNGVKIGNAEIVDTMVKDGLWDVFNDYHMGITAENLAKQYKLSRDMQDEFAYNSQLKAANAQALGEFQQEIVPLTLRSRKGEAIFDQDEFIRSDTTLEKLGQLKPAFDRQNGTVTAGNSSGLNDGAAALGIASEAALKAHSLEPLVRIVSVATAGVSPEIMGIGPVPAIQKALALAGWKEGDVDTAELNEAFAAQALSVMKELKLEDCEVNPSGGAIALGHPIGASGGRVLVTLIHRMVRKNQKRGVAALCIGGGMGIATCVELV